MFKKKYAVSPKEAFASGELVWMYPNRMVEVGTKFVIPRDCLLVWVIDDMICDVNDFDSSDWDATLTMEEDKKYRIDRVGSHSSKVTYGGPTLFIKKAFERKYAVNKEKRKAALDQASSVGIVGMDVYFVYGGKVDMFGQKSDSFVVKTKTGEKHTVRIACDLKLNIFSPKDFFNVIKQEVAILEEGMARNILREYIEEIMARHLNKSDATLEALVEDPKQTKAFIKDSTRKEFARMGIEIVDEDGIEGIENLKIEKVINPLDVTKKMLSKIKGEKRSPAAPVGSGGEIDLDFETLATRKDDDGETEIYFERVGNFGSGDKEIGANLISQNKSQTVKTYLNIDTEQKPTNYNINQPNNKPQSSNTDTEFTTQHTISLRELTESMGNQEPQTAFCENCGNQIKSTTKFCGKCGNRQ